MCVDITVQALLTVVPLFYQTYLVRGRAHPTMDPASLRFRVFSNTWKRLPRFVVDGLSPLASRLVV